MCCSHMTVSSIAALCNTRHETHILLDRIMLNGLMPCLLHTWGIQSQKQSELTQQLSESVKKMFTLKVHINCVTVCKMVYLTATFTSLGLWFTFFTTCLNMIQPMRTEDNNSRFYKIGFCIYPWFLDFLLWNVSVPVQKWSTKSTREQ